MTTHDYNTASVVLQGGTAAALVFFNESITRMIPYLIACVPLILLDLDFGIKAARKRGERIRFSKALRKTFGKGVEYICWTLLAATMSLAFGIKWIEWVVLGIVFLNELASVVGNYLETKGLEIRWAYVWNKILKIGGEKIGVDASDIDVAEAIKPKEDKPRNVKGQFTSKK